MRMKMSIFIIHQNGTETIQNKCYINKADKCSVPIAGNCFFTILPPAGMVNIVPLRYVSAGNHQISSNLVSDKH